MDKNLYNDILKVKEIFVLKCFNLLDMISDYSLKTEHDRGEPYEDVQKKYLMNKQKKNKYKAYMQGNKGGDKK